MSSSPLEMTDPVWEIATLYPPQGTWTDAGYLASTESTNRLVEFTDERVEFLPMPTKSHQLILMFLLDALRPFTSANSLGMALPAPIRVRIRPGTFREPDFVFIQSDHLDKAGDEFFEGADLVMEVVNDHPESRKRELCEKVLDYAEAGISEYWLVDPVERTMTIHTFPDVSTGYQSQRVFRRGERPPSVVLDGFVVDVSAALDAAKQG